ncbi:hypothetical protein BESB_038710 [Besnoitia besnoiti]|uniref:Tetratricopeptide repeat-containing protein n=1 Tax=Besnoitia besnoiti TaxID=94643 RepID=A0A2A9MNE6_BESBE|nr:hypothetical protein BESB_038710 [Besnoitia besnoiti]PFH37413.1 hypothetical protein BESB_038710 [Besnoitia besnoiti]
MKVQTRVAVREKPARGTEALSQSQATADGTSEVGTQRQMLADAVAQAEASTKKALLLNLSGIEQMYEKNLRTASQAFQHALSAMENIPAVMMKNQQVLHSAVDPGVLPHVPKLQSVISSNGGFVHLGLSRVSRALKAVAEAKKLWPGSPFAALLEAMCLKHSGDYETAITTLTRVEAQMRRPPRRPQDGSEERQHLTDAGEDPDGLRASAYHSGARAGSRLNTEAERSQRLLTKTCVAFDTDCLHLLYPDVAVSHSAAAVLPEWRCKASQRSEGRDEQPCVAQSRCRAAQGGLPVIDSTRRTRSPPTHEETQREADFPVAAQERRSMLDTNSTLADRLAEELEELRALSRKRHLAARDIRRRRSYAENMAILHRLRCLENDAQVHSPQPPAGSSCSQDESACGPEQQNRERIRPTSAVKQEKRAPRQGDIDAIARNIFSADTRTLPIRFVDRPAASHSAVTHLAHSSRSDSADKRMDAGENPLPHDTQYGRCRMDNSVLSDQRPVFKTPDEDRQTDGSQVPYEKDYAKRVVEPDGLPPVASRIKTTSNTVKQSTASVPRDAAPLLPTTFFSFLQQWNTKCLHQMDSDVGEKESPTDDPSRVDTCRSASSCQRISDQKSLGNSTGCNEAEANNKPSSLKALHLRGEVASESPVVLNPQQKTKTDKSCPACTNEKGLLLESLAKARVIGRLFGASLEADSLMQILRVLLDLFKHAAVNSGEHQTTTALSPANGENSSTTAAAGVPAWSVPRVKEVIAEVLTQLNSGQARFCSLLLQLEHDELNCLMEAITLSVSDSEARKADQQISGKASLSSKTDSSSPPSCKSGTADSSVIQRDKILKEMLRRVSSLIPS